MTASHAAAAAIDRFLEELVTAGLVHHPRDVIGCSDEELAQVEVHFGRPLPEAYEQFLRKVGRRAGEFWRGSTVFFPEVLRLGDTGMKEVAAYMNVRLPQHDKMIFFTHQGYEYLWMDVSTDSADPPVWQLLEGAPNQPRQVAESFTGLLLAYASQLAADGHDPEAQV